jgi:hypothetical protein
MLSDTVISIGRYSIHFPSLYLLLAGLLLLVVAGFLLGLNRGRRAVRSVLTNELAVQLARIATTLERIANLPADRAIAEASGYAESGAAEAVAAPAFAEQTEQTPEPPHRVFYSMFGR